MKTRVIAFVLFGLFGVGGVLWIAFDGKQEATSPVTVSVGSMSSAARSEGGHVWPAQPGTTGDPLQSVQGRRGPQFAVPLPREDLWRVFQVGLASQNQSEIVSAIQAAQECAGLGAEDVSSLVSQAGAVELQGTSTTREQRVAAAQAYVSRCAGFARQSTEQDVAALWHKLSQQQAPAAVAKQFADHAHMVGLSKALAAKTDDLCRLFADSPLQPGVADQLLPVLQDRLFTEGTVLERGVAASRAHCMAKGDCGAWTSTLLVQCALAGDCDPSVPGSLQLAGLTSEKWHRAASQGEATLARLRNTQQCRVALGEKGRVQ